MKGKCGPNWISVCLAGAFALFAGGCGTFEVRVPSSSLPGFQYCIAHSAGACMAAPPSGMRSVAATVPTSTVTIMEAGSRKAWNFIDTGAAPERSVAVGGDAIDYYNRQNDLFDRFANHAVTRAMLGTSQPTQAEPYVVTRSDMKEYLEIVSDLNVNDGWAMAARSGDRSRREGAARNIYAAYLGVYFNAYFRNGEFGSIGVQFSDIYTRYPELKQYHDALDPILEKAAGGLSYGKVGTAAFISRTGRQLQFPPLEITIDPTKPVPVSTSKIDYSDVGADLVRIIVEALFDARDQLPAVQNATGAISANFESGEKNFVLAQFKPGQGVGTLTNEQFTQSASIANSAEGTTAALVAEIIRGISIASLNNEAVAKALEALAGASARKATEKATYCWYACVINDAGASPESSRVRGIPIGTVPPGPMSRTVFQVR